MATQVRPTFEVDKQGMAAVFARKGKAFIVTELIQNAWDEDTSQVDVTLEAVKGDQYRIVVEDDNPEGFANLAHAYTLFAESLKKGDAEKRGRFNLGEKLVISICDKSSIETTKGTILFDEKGRRHVEKKRKQGSRFTGTLRLSKKDVQDIERAVHALLPPPGITTTFNLVDVPRREPVRAFEVTLRTEISDADGRLKPTTRKTTVELFEPVAGETPMVYELGIPVVAIEGDRWHVNVGQKVPLPLDRDNLPPAYLRHLRVEVLNHGYDLLTADEAKAAWVNNALEDDRVSAEAAKAAFKGKFGEKAVIFDPNDPEANKIAAEQGYTVVPGGALPKGAWANVKGAGAALPAGQVTPSPNPNEGEENLKMMDPAHYPEAVERIVTFAHDFGGRLLDGADVKVRVANDPTYPFAATYGPRRGKTEGLLTLNLGRLGFGWFEQGGEPVIDLLIHEFGHHYCGDHLDRRYLDALTLLGARAVRLALTEAGFFDAVMGDAVAGVAA